MSERKAGWYWVWNDDEWMPAYYGVMAWTWAYMSMDGCDELEIHEDEDVPFDKIGPRIPSPDEDYVTMPRDVYDMICAAGRKTIDRIDRTWDSDSLPENQPISTRGY